MNGQRSALIMVWLVFTLAIISPVSSAIVVGTYVPPSSGPLEKDNPEVISVLKTHTAYVGIIQQARMDGVIAYIDQISEGAGTTNLRWIQDDYIAAVSSIPLLYTSDEITAVREEMRSQSIRFSDETKTQISVFNGNNTELRARTSVTETEAEVTFNNMPDSVWLMKGSARLAAFNISAEKRAALLLSLARKGVDVTDARNISEQIDAMRTELQAAVVYNKEGVILTLNSGIGKLNSQFRSIVDESLKNREIQIKAAEIMAMK